MTEIYYEIVAYTDNDKMVYISNTYKDDGMIGIRLTIIPVSMTKEEAYALMNYITEIFNVFKQLRLIRTERTYNEKTGDIDCIYDIEIEVFR